MWKLSVPVLLVGLCLAACGSSDTNDRIPRNVGYPGVRRLQSFDDGGEFVVALSPILPCRSSGARTHSMASSSPSPTPTIQIFARTRLSLGLLNSLMMVTKPKGRSLKTRAP